MATPIIERIAVQIAAAIAAIKPAAGYQMTVAAVERPKGPGLWTPGDNKVVLLQAPDAVAEGDEAEAGYELKTRPFIAVCLAKIDEAAAGSADSRLNVFAADVERAMMSNLQWADAGTGTRLARITTIGSPPPFPEWVTGYAGICVRADVQYRHKLGDPYSL